MQISKELRSNNSGGLLLPMKSIKMLKDFTRSKIAILRLLKSCLDEYRYFGKLRQKKYEDMDEDYLYAEMMTAAHILEKNIYVFEYPHFQRLEVLTKILNSWDAKFDKENRGYMWAKEILERNKAMVNEKLSYPSNPNLLSNTSTNFWEIIKSRRSVRKWKKKEVPQTLIERIIEAGRWAPSSCNRQTIKCLVIRNENDREYLGKIIIGGEGFLHNSPVHILILEDIRSYHLPFQRHMPYIDAGVAIENMLLVTHAEGLGACILNGSITPKNEKAVRARFKIADYYLPIALIAIGFPNHSPYPPPRKDLHDFIVYDTFGNKR